MLAKSNIGSLFKFIWKLSFSDIDSACTNLVIYSDSSIWSSDVNSLKSSPLLSKKWFLYFFSSLSIYHSTFSKTHFLFFIIFDLMSWGKSSGRRKAVIFLMIETFPNEIYIFHSYIFGIFWNASESYSLYNFI